jgi:hypothetical protein
MTRQAARALLILLLFTVPAQAADPWHEFHSPSGGYAVLLPGAVERVDNKSDFRGKTRSVVTYSGVLGEEAFIVSCAEFLPGYLKRLTLDRMFELLRDGYVRGGKGKLRIERSFTMGGSRGREVVIDRADGSSLKGWMIVAGDRIYQVTFLGPTGSEKRPEVDRFLASFRFTAQYDQPAPKP